MAVDGLGERDRVLVKVVALLAWFDENPVWLRNLPATLKKQKITHLVALDGRYSRFPSDYDESPLEQVEALQIGCQLHGVELLFEQGGPYEGDEVEKRTRLFALAESVTSEDDWYMVIDADTYIAKPDKQLHDKLANTSCDAAYVRLMQGTECQAEDFRAFFRAKRGLHCDTNHYTYRAGDGTLLWADPAREDNLSPAEPTNVVFQHLNPKRDPDRTARAGVYYRRRQEDLTEYGDCQYCGEVQAVLKVPDQWYWKGSQLRAKWFESCRSCATTRARDLPRQFVELGASRAAAEKVLTELFA